MFFNFLVDAKERSQLLLLLPIGLPVDQGGDEGGEEGGGAGEGDAGGAACLGGSKPNQRRGGENEQEELRDQNSDSGYFLAKLVALHLTTVLVLN